MISIGTILATVVVSFVFTFIFIKVTTKVIDAIFKKVDKGVIYFCKWLNNDSEDAWILIQEVYRTGKEETTT